MTQNPGWLERMAASTTYAELQAVYAKMAAEVVTRPNDPGLVDAIDRAIQRLVEERARDEQELNAAKGQYESFKSQHSGVVGWLRRHVPFTETRKQEKQHRGGVDDQTAEILADNLFIARAQILKENILPAERRRLGPRLADWQSQWDGVKAQSESAADLLKRLHAAQEPARAFVGELKKDVDAFADAAFQDKADRERRDQDLAAARGELNSLGREIEAKEDLLDVGLGIVAAGVASGLSATDEGFRRDGTRIQAVQSCMARLDGSRTALGALAATVAKIVDANKQLSALPEQVRQARDAMARAESDRTSAEQSRVAKSQPIPGLESRLSEAQRAASQARQQLSALQPAYDARRAQQPATPELAEAVELDTGAAIEQQYRSAQSAVEQAETVVRTAQAALDAARRDLGQVESAVRDAADRIAREQKRISELESRDRQLRSELDSLEGRGQHEFLSAESALGAFLAEDRSEAGLPHFRPEDVAAGTFGWIGPGGLDRAFANSLLQPGPDAMRQPQAVAVLDRLIQWLESRRRGLDQERSQLRARRESLWRDHCRRLLGDALVDAACRDGLKDS